MEELAQNEYLSQLVYINECNLEGSTWSTGGWNYINTVKLTLDGSVSWPCGVSVKLILVSLTAAVVEDCGIGIGRIRKCIPNDVCLWDMHNNGRLQRLVDLIDVNSNSPAITQKTGELAKSNLSVVSEKALCLRGVCYWKPNATSYKEGCWFSPVR